MQNLKIFSPVKNEKDIEYIANTNCKNFYVFSKDFFKNHEKIQNYINKAIENNLEIYVNFESDIKENELE